MIDLSALLSRVRPIVAEIQTTAIPVEPGRLPPQPQRHAPFITISRQAGAGGRSLAECLAKALNALEPAEPPWTCWDRELVEKVATDHHISKDLIEGMEEASHNWLEEFFSGLAGVEHGQPEEARIYRRVVATARALAENGRVILVGRGGVFVTRNMPGGIHIRLVASFPHRVAHMAALLNLTEKEAAARVRELDRNREAFFKRYWPSESLSPEMFTMVLNTDQLSDEQMVELLTPLIHQRVTV